MFVSLKTFTRICFGYITIWLLWFPHSKLRKYLFKCGQLCNAAICDIKKSFENQYLLDSFFNLLRCILLDFRIPLGTRLGESAVSYSDQQVEEQSLISKPWGPSEGVISVNAPSELPHEHHS